MTKGPPGEECVSSVHLLHLEGVFNNANSVLGGLDGVKSQSGTLALRHFKIFFKFKASRL